MKGNPFIPNAQKPISNIGCLCIQVSEDGSCVRYQRYGNKPSRWQEIKYDKEGEPYFIEHHTRQYLNEFMTIYR